MLLRFAAWKIALIAVVVVIGCALAVPNLLPASVRSSIPGFLPSGTVKLGLDLRGGSYLLLEVDPEELRLNRLRSLSSRIAEALNARPGNVRYRGREVVGDAVRLRLVDPDQASEAVRRIEDLGGAQTSGLSEVGSILEVTRRGQVIETRYSSAELGRIGREALSDTIEVVRRRIDAAGTLDPNIQRQGDSRIVVEVPGVDDPTELIDIMTRTGVMTINLVDETVDPSEYVRGLGRSGRIRLSQIGGPDLVIHEDPVLTGKDLATASQGFDERSLPQINFSLKGRGPRVFAEFTTQNTGRRFAIVLDGVVVSAPQVRTPILGGSGRITGNFSVQEAERIAVVLRAGELPARLQIVEQRVVGAGLGADSVRAGSVASVLGLLLVAVFMMLAYGLLGVFAVVSLAANIMLILGALSGLGASLTLPGVAGIILTIGMAVDANVLVFERIREEVRQGRGPVSAVEAGYSRALATILDANITTLIAAVILFQFGSGPVRGFAVTLGLGVISSVFTAFMLTRFLTAVWLRRTRPSALWV